jgi:DNA ligase (NAD+)
LVTDAASLWDLREDRLKDLEGWGETSARNLISGLERARNQPLARLIFGLGIPLVGERAAKLLASEFGSVEAIAAADETQLVEVDGVGPVMASAVVRWFADPSNRQLVARLRDRGVDPHETAADDAPGPLDGEVVVITGSLSRPRSRFRDRLEGLGAKVTGSVSQRTSLLVAGGDAGSKLAKARELGVSIVDEAGLDALVMERSGRPLWEQ